MRRSTSVLIATGLLAASITQSPAALADTPAPAPEAPPANSAPAPEAPPANSAPPPEAPPANSAPPPEAPPANSAPPPEAPPADSAPPANTAPPKDTWVDPPQTRLIANHLLAFRYNPLGFEYQLRTGFQRRLYKSDAPALRDNFFFFGAAPRVNPAFVKIGPSMEIQPLSMFNLRVGAEVVGFFSTFGFLQSFTSPLADYSDSSLQAGRDSKRNYAAVGGHVMIEPSFQAKLGPIVLRDKVALEFWKMNVHVGDRVFYDITADTVISREGWTLQNDADLLFMHEFKEWTGTFRGARLAFGARYTLVRPLYTGKDFAPEDDPALEDNGHHRVGPVVAFTFFDHGFERFNRPTAIVIANWYADHRFRTGQDVSQAVPYLVVGLSAQSDFWK